jgi:FlaA1/EpsC-like NDP-sugar epimerase
MPMFSQTQTALPFERAAKGAVALCVPRLADFSYANTASLVSPLVLRGAFRAFEGVSIALIGLVIALNYVDEPLLHANPYYAAAHVAMGLMTIVVLELFGLYTMPALSSAIANLPRLLAGWTVAFMALMASVFFAKLGTEFSRVWLAAWFAFGGLGLVVGRLVLATWLRTLARQGRLYRRAAIYGTGEVTADLIAALEADLSGDIRICGIFDDRDDERSAKLIAGYPRLGGLADLVAFGRQTRLDLVLVSLPISAEDRLAAVTRSLAVLPTEIKLPARATKLRFTPGTYSHVGSVAMIDLYDKPITACLCASVRSQCHAIDSPARSVSGA